MKNRSAQYFAFLLLMLSESAIASGGTGKYALDWHKPGQFVEYHSCGCADACWIAQVKERRSHKVLATLSCDCETLYYSLSNVAFDRPHELSCSVFENDHKAQLISLELKRLLGQ